MPRFTKSGKYTATVSKGSARKTGSGNPKPKAGKAKSKGKGGKSHFGL